MLDLDKECSHIIEMGAYVLSDLMSKTRFYEVLQDVCSTFNNTDVQEAKSRLTKSCIH